MHGDKDELVPIEQGKMLYEKANEPKEFYTIPGAAHNDTHIVGGEEYFDVIRDFVNKLENKIKMIMPLVLGNQAIEGGNLILTTEEKNQLVLIQE